MLLVEMQMFRTAQHHVSKNTSWISAVIPATGTGPARAPTTPPPRNRNIAKA